MSKIRVATRAKAASLPDSRGSLVDARVALGIMGLSSLPALRARRDSGELKEGVHWVRVGGACGYLRYFEASISDYAREPQDVHSVFVKMIERENLDRLAARGL